MNKRISSACGVMVLLHVLLVRAVAADALPGTLDTSFDAGATMTRPVYAAAVREDGKVAITGDFTSVHRAAANGLALLEADGATDIFFTNSMQGLRVIGRSIAFLLDGKILVGGYFYNPNTGFFSGLMRFNPDGSLDETFDSPVIPYVYCMAVLNDGRVLVGGSFNSQGRRGILRLNADGSVDNSFLYAQPGVNGTVFSLSVMTNGQILIAGSFTTVNGSPKSSVARLNADGSVDETFSATVTGVLAVAAQADGKALIGGSFSVVNGTSRNRVARLRTDGSLDTSFNPGTGADGNLSAIHVQADGKILLAGAFNTVNGASARGLARLNVGGSVDGTFSTGAGGINGNVNSITPQPNGQIIIGGSFSTVGGVLRNQLARLGTSGSLDSSFANGPIIFTGNVTAIARQADGKFLVNSVARTGIGRFLADGSPDSSFLAGQAGANGAVTAIAAPAAGRILVAGQFTQFNGVPALALVRLDNTGGVDAGFQNGIGGSSGSINAMAVQPDGRILIAGAFTQIRGVGRTNIARLNTDGSLDNTFQANMEGVKGTVNTLRLQADGKVLLGGVFTSVNGIGRTNIARLNADGTLDRTFVEGMRGLSGPAYSLAQQADLKVVVAGLFTNANGTAVSHVTRLMPDGSRDTNFTTGTISVPSLGIRALALQSDGGILIGGDISSVAGLAFNNIARLRTNGSVEAFLRPTMGAMGPVTALMLLDGSNALVGGGFGSFNEAGRSYLARFTYIGVTVPLEVAIDNATLSWTNDAVAPWLGQPGVAHDTVSAAQSPAISDNESASFTATINGPGCLSFWWKVSSETNFDYLIFNCRGAVLTNQLAISGEVDWEQRTVCIPEGSYVVKWTYQKDWSVSVGLDAGWVDQVTFTPGNTAPLVTAGPVNSTNIAGGSVLLSVQAAGIPPLSYQWLLNGAEIIGATNATYLVTSIVPEQAGNYSVRVSNPFGSTVSAAAELIVVPVRALGADDYGQATVTLATVDTKAVAAGQYHSLFLKRDGSIHAFGNNGSGQCTVPTTLGAATGIAAGGYHSLAIKTDGTVAGWGDNTSGQSTPPAGLSDVIAVAAGTWHSLALKADGTVVGWGDNTQGQARPLAGLTNIIAIAAGGAHSLALRADGIVFGWGGNLGPNGTYAGQAFVPWNLTNIIAVGAGGYHSVAVKNDGSIVGWGDNSAGQLTVPTNLPPAMAISGGGAHTVALFADGTAAAWGANFDGQCNIDRTLTNVVAAVAGDAHSLLLFAQRPPPPDFQLPALANTVFTLNVPTIAGKFYALDYKNSVLSTNWVALPAVRGSGQILTLSDFTPASSPQRYYRVRQW